MFNSHLPLARAICVAICVASSLQQTVIAQPTTVPIALHPDNGHYFQWQGKPTILITSGEHYGALLNQAFDFQVYFQTLAKNRLNHTRTFSGAYRELPNSFGITHNPLSPKAEHYIGPWPRSDQPGNADGGNRFDLSQWNPAYFQRLHDYMRAAQQHGVVVEFTFFCPMYNDDLWKLCPMQASNNINQIGDCHREEVYTLKHPELLDVQLQLVRKIVAELKSFDNLIYEVCNEPYFGGVTLDWQHRVVDTIVEAEKDFPHKHLISMNIANGSKQVESPHPHVSVFNFHYCVPPTAVAENFALNRVIGENETGFRGQADVLYRTEAWDFLLAGGGLFNNLDYSFTPATPDGSLLEYKSPGGGSPRYRHQLQILREFLEQSNFIAMRPDRDVIRQVTPDLTWYALSEAGTETIAYLHVPIPNKPKSTARFETGTIDAKIVLALPAGQYSVTWLDPKSGAAGEAQAITHAGGELHLPTHHFVTDTALRIRRTAR